MDQWIIKVCNTIYSLRETDIPTTFYSLNESLLEYIDNRGVSPPKNINIDTLILGGDEYCVLGDNLNKSYDSRFYGSIKRSSVKRKFFIKLNW